MDHLSKHLLYKLKPKKISLVDTTQFEDRFDCADVNKQNLELFMKAFEQRRDITKDTIRSEPQWAYIQNTGAWIDLHEPINAEDGVVLFGKEKFNNILLIDVRENKEFNKSSIKGSISIPLNNLEQKSHLEFIKQESLDKEVFTLCQVGKRSEKASKILIKFKIPSKSIEGGIKKINQIIFN